MKKPSCGLDFGTSNSTIGHVDEGDAPLLVRLEGDAAPMPSVLFFNFEDDRTYFGNSAVAEYTSGADGRMMRSLKSVLGTSLMDEFTRIKGNRIGFSKILETFIRQVRSRAQSELDGELDNVVVGRPVRFVDDDDALDRLAEKQLRSAVKNVGFENVEFQFEPIAAALDYERGIAEEELALVVDIGGGTSDFTVIRISPDRARTADRSQDILATAGVHVGGTDFDHLLSMAKIMPELGLGTQTRVGNLNLPIGPYYDLSTWHRINRLYTRSAMVDLNSIRQQAEFPERLQQLLALVRGRYGHLLASHVEGAKIDLTHVEQVKFCFENPDILLQTDINRDELDAAIVEAVMRIPDTINRLLRAAGLVSEDVQTLIMTGGSTQIPLLRGQLDRQFSEAKFVQNDAFGSVGLGLALDASRRF